MKNYWVNALLWLGLGFGLCYLLCIHSCKKETQEPIVITAKAIHDSFTVYVDSSKGWLKLIDKRLAEKDKIIATTNTQLRDSRLNEKKAWDYVNILQNPTKETLDSLKALANLNNDNCDLLVNGLEGQIGLYKQAISIKDTLQYKTANLLDTAITRGTQWQGYSNDLNKSLRKQKGNTRLWKSAAVVFAILSVVFAVK